MDGKRGSGVGSGVRLESSNLSYSHRKMTKVSRTPPVKQNYSSDPPPPQEISRPKHRWIVIKKIH